MDKLKNLLKSDTPTDGPPPSGATGKITGQGSHFPHHNEPSATQPTTVTGTEPSTQGAADVSAVKTDPVQASATAGPEQGGSEHVNTVPAESVSATKQVDTTPEAQSYTATNADFPKTEGSTDGGGTAAIGSTSTYTSSRLPQGDPLSSVVDKDSSDPISYKKPESGAGSAGVGAGAASAAATTAFVSSQERGPGHENPYRASDIDPRVDGGATTSAPSNVADATTTSSSGAGAGFAAAGATTAYHQVTEERQAQPQSTLTTAVNPTDRSAAYTQAAATQGLDEAKPSTTSATQPTDSTEEKPGVVGKVLGAVGLGGLAGAAAAKVSGDHEKAVDDTPEPTTTTGVSSYTAPTQQGPEVSHHRKESIPTTAYPAGVDSPDAISAPVGGTRATTTESASQSIPPTDTTQTSSDAADHTATTAVAGAGLGAGAGAAGAAAVDQKHYSDSKELREEVTGEQSSSVAPPVENAPGQATTGVPQEAYTESKALRDNATTEPTSTAAADDSTKPEEDHTARNVAIGAGAGAAAAGAGVAGAEYSKKEAEKAEAEAAKQEAAHQKEIEEQEKAARKQAEKEQKAAEKEEKAHQKAVEKEEKKHQKEVEKEQKQHQKEVEKEEKKHQKEVAAAEKKQEKEEKQHQKELAKEEKERQKQAEEDERRRQAAVAAAAASTEESADGEKDVKADEQEKKPSLLKRIFRRRKNSKTGEEEEYEAEEEEDKTTPVVAGTAVAGGATAAAVATHDEPSHSTAAAESEPVDPLASTQPPSQTGAAGFVSTGPDGKPQYTVVPQPAPETTAATTSNTQTTEPTSGLSSDPATESKAAGLSSDPVTSPEKTGVFGSSQTDTNTTAADTGDQGRSSLEERIEAMVHDKFGVVEDHKR